MIDTRELILAQIAVTLATVTGIVTVFRNRGAMKEDKFPACGVMDGDERTRLDGDRRGRVRVSPELVTMRPQIFIIMDQRAPLNTDIGPDLNAKRAAVIQALSQDADLLDLVGSNGNIAYDGCETDLKSGQQGLGQMRLDFSITYVVDPYST